MIRAIFFSLAMLLSVLPAQGQAIGALERIGASPAARNLALRLARQSSMVRAVLEQLGVRVASEEAAVAQWRALSPAQLGAAISRNNELERLYLGSSSLRPEDRALWGSTINTIRLHKLDAPVIKSLELGKPPTLSELLNDPLVPCDDDCRAILRWTKRYSLGASTTVPLSVYVDSLVERQKDKP